MPADEAKRPVLSVVVPCFDEQEVLPEFHRRLASAMNGIGLDWDVLYVNDGSRDRTLLVIQDLAAQDPRIGWLNLSRNFGKEAALTAGLDHALGSGGVVVIDADLQDPPEVIPNLVAAWGEGIDMAYARRRRREGDGPMKRLTATLFYRLISRVGHRVEIPEDSGDFRLISRRALDALLELREHHRFMKGLFAWVGFSSRAVLYDRAPRAAGSTKWNYWSLWNFAIEGITGFSVLPLKISTYVGLLVAFGALIFGLQLIARTLLFGNPIPGYPSIMAVVLFLGGVQLITLGVIGEYLGRIANESKRRPLYVVERFAPAVSAAPTPRHANGPGAAFRESA
ncbi:glycosyltransferase family 2 protein [Lichenicola sp.]|uniref:glycosyltransferase family 2 protein n=1 Tax=Lichenicola sp. TaxID=2804529 RepID=UPI003B00D74D